MSDRKTAPSRGRRAHARLSFCHFAQAGITAAFLTVAGTLANPASADDLINPEAKVHVSDKYQSPGALPQGAGVLDRARPEYDALGLPVGSFILYPTFATGLSYDDNIFRTSAASAGDSFWITPRPRKKSPRNRLRQKPNPRLRG